MKLATLQAGQFVETGGYYTKGGAGAARYLVKTVAQAATDGDVVDDISSHTLANANVAIIVIDVSTDITQFGAKEGDSSGFDNSIRINAYISLMNKLVMPVGIFEIHNPLKVLNAGIANGVLWQGQGVEQSIIRCVGMTGKNGIELEAATGLYRFNFSNFRVDGDSDHAISLNTSDDMWDCEFRNLIVFSVKDAFRVDNHFSCLWVNVRAESETGHSFNLEGGNSTTLINCYAIKAGVGKAGYRIRSIATLIGCNGLNSGEHWGIFGATIADDGYNAVYFITLTGCNLEEFKINAIETKYQGSLSITNSSFIAPLASISATFDEYINFTCANSNFKMNGYQIATKGSVRQSAENIVASNTFGSLEVSGGADIVEYRIGGLSYKAPVHSVSGVEYGVQAEKLTDIDYDRSYGFNLQVPVTWTPDANSFDCSGRTKIIMANTIPTMIQNGTGAKSGQELYLLIQDSFTTIDHAFGGSGRFINKSGADIVASSGEVLHYIYNNSVEWVQV